MSHLHSTDAQLFVHLTWATHNNCPLLGNDQLRQAAYGAIQTRTRSHLCHILAIGGTPCQIGVIASFPASLPIATLVRLCHEAAKDALVRVQETMSGNFEEPPCYWGRDYTAHTLSAEEAAEAKAYLRQRLPPPAL